MANPHQFTLNLLRNLIEGAPKAFPLYRRNEMTDVYHKLSADQSAANEVIEQRVIEFGKEIWPYREAYLELYEEYGRGKEEKMLAAGLGEDLRPKYEKFIAEKGNIERLRGQALSLDIYFTPDEQDEIIKAELRAHDKTHNELEKLIAGEKQEEYFGALEKRKKKQAEIEEALARLTVLAAVSEKWRAEILDKVKTFELGFGYLERPVTLLDVMGEIEYYEGIIGLENGN